MVGLLMKGGLTTSCPNILVFFFENIMLFLMYIVPSYSELPVIAIYRSIKKYIDRFFKKAFI